MFTFEFMRPRSAELVASDRGGRGRPPSERLNDLDE